MSLKIHVGCVGFKALQVTMYKELLFHLYVFCLNEKRTNKSPVVSFLAGWIFLFGPLMGMCISLPCREPLYQRCQLVQSAVCPCWKEKKKKKRFVMWMLFFYESTEMYPNSCSRCPKLTKTLLGSVCTGWKPLYPERHQGCCTWPGCQPCVKENICSLD